MVMAGPLRTIIETGDFETERDKHLEVRAYDEIVEAVTWALARDPERYKVQGTDRLGAIETNAFADIPSFLIVYTFDDDTVYLRWIEPITPAETV